MSNGKNHYTPTQIRHCIVTIYNSMNYVEKIKEFISMIPNNVKTYYDFELLDIVSDDNLTEDKLKKAISEYHQKILSNNVENKINVDTLLRLKSTLPKDCDLLQILLGESEIEKMEALKKYREGLTDEELNRFLDEKELDI